MNLVVFVLVFFAAPGCCDVLPLPQRTLRTRYQSLISVHSTPQVMVFNESVWRDLGLEKQRAETLTVNNPYPSSSTSWAFANCTYLSAVTTSGQTECHIVEGRAGNGSWPSNIKFNGTVTLPSGRKADCWTYVPANTVKTVNALYFVPPYSETTPTNRLQRLEIERIFRAGKLQTEVVNSHWIDHLDDEAELFSLPPACWDVPDPMQFCTEDEPRWRCDNRSGGCVPCVGSEKKVCTPDLHACAARCHHPRSSSGTDEIR